MDNKDSRDPPSLGEVSNVYINGAIYAMGQGYSNTCRLTSLANSWDCTLPERPFKGNHHAPVTVPGQSGFWLVGWWT